MKKLFAYSLLLTGLLNQAFAGDGFVVPEINASTAVGALSLVSGAVLILRTRRK